MKNAGEPRRVALLDTTIQIDRLKNKPRRQRIEDILKQYEWKLSTCISLLEFKAVLIQQCITIHNQLRLRGRFTVVRDSLTEHAHPQVRLRNQIFNNLINVLAPSSFDVTVEDDKKFAEQARLKLEQDIPRLHRWFRSSVDSVLEQGIACTRANERPAKKRVSFGVCLPADCNRFGKSCRVEEFIRGNAQGVVQAIRDAIGAMPSDRSEQLERSLELFHRVSADPEVLISHQDCRRAGDCLIAMEAISHASHALSTNVREWQCLSQALGYEFVKIDYPEERTR